MEFTDKDAYEMQIVENLQRKTLDPVEEAMSYRRYVIDFGWGGVSELGRRIGKSEEYVSHRMQLLKLSKNIQENVSNKVLGVSQALELTDMNLGDRTQELAQEIIDNKMTVRQIRQIKNEMKQAESFDYSGLESRQQNARQSSAAREVSIVKRSVVALRIALSRLDDLIERANRDDGGNERVELVSFLMDMRTQVHTMIDDTLKYKKAHCSDR